jgi:hypothetical protein
MGKRGPKPRGEFDQTTVFTCRLTAQTRRFIDAAKKKSGRSFGQELEHWLRRAVEAKQYAIDHFGNDQNEAICKLIGLTIQATGALRRKKDDPKSVEIDPTLWLRDASVFDATMSGILHLMAGFRPGGADPSAGIHMTTAARALLEELRKAEPADLSVPLGQAENKHEVALADLKADLGELAEPYEKWAEPTVPAVKKNRAFRRNRK